MYPCRVVKRSMLLIVVMLQSLIALSQLNADFSVDYPAGCAPLVVKIINKTTGSTPSTSYSWDLGNGNKSSIKDPSAIFDEEKSYTIKLTVTDGNKVSTKSQDITVYKKPTVDFTASSMKGCVPFDVTFNSSSTAGSGNISSYHWDFGDGTTLEGRTLTQQHTYLDPTNASISLTVVNSHGCHTTLKKEKLVEVLPLLDVQFSADKQYLCKVDEPVKFTNSTTGPGIISYQWDFGNGGTSVEKSPIKVFNTKGTYTVKLTAISSEGCTASETQTNYLNVADYSSSFSSPALVCNDASVTFQSNSKPVPTGINWFIDGYNHYNNYPQFNAYFSTPGKHEVRLINQFGTCLDTVTKSIIVEKTPSLQGFKITQIDSCGQPLRFAFADTTAEAVKWEWDFTHTFYSTEIKSTKRTDTFAYNQYGYYYPSLKIYSAKGCSRETVVPLSVAEPTVYMQYESAITPYKVYSCDSLVYKFSASSLHEIATFEWVFEDGEVSNESSPTHVFKKPGSHTVRLNYITRAGCKGTIYSHNFFTILAKPEADFRLLTNDTLCGNIPAIVEPLVNGNYTYTYWMVDNSYSYHGNLSNIEFHLQDTGYHNFQFIVFNEGCSDTATKNNFVYVLPSFPRVTTVQNTCDGTRGEVTFSQESRYATKWKWNFGDGREEILNVNSPSIKHTYSATGQYKVVLTTYNGACENRDSTTAYVLLKQKPKLSADITEVCKDDAWRYVLENYDTHPYPYYYDYGHYTVRKLEYGDGTAFQGYSDYYSNFWRTTPFHGELKQFAPGQDKIRLISTAIYFGCDDTTNFVPLVIRGSTAAFKISDNEICYNNDAVFQDASVTSPGNTIQSRTWNFGDGHSVTSTANSISHRYTEPGYYPVVLSITDNSGCTTSTTSFANFIAVTGPKAAFNSSGTDVPLNTHVQFFNETNEYNAYNTRYLWDFGDGTEKSTAHSPSHQYTKAGTYTVTLTATDASKNCSSSITRTIKVSNFNAAFSMSHTNITSSGCPPIRVQFNNTSQNAVSIRWDFGDGEGAANVNSPSHVYTHPGKYKITLHVTGPNGLEEKFYDSLEITVPSAKATPGKNEICKGTEASISLNTNEALKVTWDFGDGTIARSTDSTAIHKFQSAGEYLPRILLTDLQGCTSFVSVERIIVRPDPKINITPIDPVICQGQSLQLNATGASYYVWKESADLSNIQISNPVVHPSADAVYAVSGTDDIGCKGEASVKVQLQKPFAVIASDKQSICDGQTASLTVTGADTFKWISNTGTLSDVNAASVVARPTEHTEYVVVGYDKHGCFTDTATAAVEVWNNPLVSAGNDVELMSGSSAQLRATGSGDIKTWLWQPATYLSCSNCADPVTTTPVDMKYKVIVSTDKGCVAEDEVVVKMLCEEKRIGVPNAFTPNGDGKNDVFTISGIAVVDKMVVYNRWGYKVFERSNLVTSDKQACWNGTNNGRLLDSGTYTYYMEMKCPAGGKFSKRGTVTLVR